VSAYENLKYIGRTFQEAPLNPPSPRVYVVCAASRAFLLAQDHTQAATVASLHLPSLLRRQCACMGITVDPPQQQQQHPDTVGSSSSIATCSDTAGQVLPELWEWQDCLESLERGQLLLPCWQEMFACNLCIAALRAFCYGYIKVGTASQAVTILCNFTESCQISCHHHMQQKWSLTINACQLCAK
jgi:hypothetical protein